MDLEIIKTLYVVIAFLAVAFSACVNWKSSDPSEKFNLAKFFSTYIRTVWGLVPLALGLAVFGFTIEGVLAILAAAFGIDNAILRSKKLGNGKKNNKSPPV